MTQALAFISLVTALVALLWDGSKGRLLLPRPALLLVLAAIGALALFQLVPLPQALHRTLAPGSAFFWHPFEPAAVTVLGPGPHPVSVYPEATRRWLALGAGFVALALAAQPALRDRRLFLRSSAVVVASGFAVAVYGLGARVFFDRRLHGVFDVPTPFPFGPFVSKNHFAGYVEMAAVVALGLALGITDEARRRSGWLGWVDSPRAVRVVLTWSLAAVLVLSIPVSLSRGGVVSLAGGVAVLVALRLKLRSRHRKTSGWIAVSIVAGLALSMASVAAVLPDTARSRVVSLTGITGDEAGAYRLDVWRDTLRLMAASPGVGVGFGAYGEALPRFKSAAGHLRVDHAENDYMELLAEGGAVGAVLLGLLGLLVFWSGWREACSEAGRRVRSLRVAALAALATLLVHGMFDFNLRIPSNLLVFVTLAGLAVAGSHSSDHPAREGLDVWAGRALVAGLIVALLLAVVTPWHLARIEDQSARLGAAEPGVRLRRAASSRATRELLLRRPTHAQAWLLLSWLKLSGSEDDEGRSLARWGARLDPRHERLQETAEGLLAPPRPE